MAILNHGPFGVNNHASIAMEKNITAVVKRQSFTAMNTGQSASVFPTLHANNEQSLVLSLEVQCSMHL